MAQGTPGGPPLAAGKAKFLGGVYSASQLPGFTAYWNQVTPENAGKWGSVEAVRDRMNWTELDAAYAFAKGNGYPFRLHVLVWGNQQPAWIETLPADEQLREIEQWFAAVAARYPC
ncbi:MAG: endo-1,4-beta-xylanase [Verrucomicrobia bacterium]|nr:endo-1,4-beta-xylanase [Verrucomicrobiota bacterium]